jgi:hypothetical protein
VPALLLLLLLLLLLSMGPAITAVLIPCQTIDPCLAPDHYTPGSHRAAHQRQRVRPSFQRTLRYIAQTIESALLWERCCRHRRRRGSLVRTSSGWAGRGRGGPNRAYKGRADHPVWRPIATVALNSSHLLRQTLAAPFHCIFSFAFNSLAPILDTHNVSFTYVFCKRLSFCQQTLASALMRCNIRDPYILIRLSASPSVSLLCRCICLTELTVVPRLTTEKVI